MRTKTKALLLSSAVAALVLAMPAAADIAMPMTVQVYFTRDGKPYERPVDFAVACRGWMNWPGQSRPAESEPRKIIEVYRFSAKCPSYGCELNHSLYLNYRHIESCDASGTAGGKPFTIGKFGTSPLGDCNQLSLDGKSGRRCILRLSLPK